MSRLKAGFVAMAQPAQIPRRFRHVGRDHPHDHAREAGVVEQRFEMGLRRRLQPLPWFGRLGHGIDRLADPPDAFLVDGHQQPVLGWEMHIDGAHRHAHLAGDVADGRGGVAVRAEPFRGDAQDTLARLLLAPLPDDRFAWAMAFFAAVSERSFTRLSARRKSLSNAWDAAVAD